MNNVAAFDRGGILRLLLRVRFALTASYENDLKDLKR